MGEVALTFMCYPRFLVVAQWIMAFGVHLRWCFLQRSEAVGMALATLAIALPSLDDRLNVCLLESCPDGMEVRFDGLRK